MNITIKKGKLPGRYIIQAEDALVKVISAFAGTGHPISCNSIYTVKSNDAAIKELAESVKAMKTAPKYTYCIKDDTVKIFTEKQYKDDLKNAINVKWNETEECWESKKRNLKKIKNFIAEQL